MDIFGESNHTGEFFSGVEDNLKPKWMNRKKSHNRSQRNITNLNSQIKIPKKPVQIFQDFVNEAPTRLKPPQRRKKNIPVFSPTRRGKVNNPSYGRIKSPPKRVRNNDTQNSNKGSSFSQKFLGAPKNTGYARILTMSEKPPRSSIFDRNPQKMIYSDNFMGKRKAQPSVINYDVTENKDIFSNGMFNRSKKKPISKNRIKRPKKIKVRNLSQHNLKKYKRDLRNNEKYFAQKNAEHRIKRPKLKNLNERSIFHETSSVILNPEVSSTRQGSEIIPDEFSSELFDYLPTLSLPQTKGLSKINGYITKKKSLIDTPKRFVGHAPVKVLDAPDIINDYYLNTLDWSEKNIIGVGLAENVYLWNSKSGEVHHVFQCKPPDYISSIKFSRTGKLLAVGTSFSVVQLWDVSRMKLLRTLQGHVGRIAVNSWFGNIISSGCRNGNIVNHDVRVKQSVICKFKEHTMEVCGLDWKQDGYSIASGSNDNLCKIWDIQYPLQSKRGHSYHTGAVKCVRWVPWEKDVLITGGGTTCKRLFFFNDLSEKIIREVNTGSQVCQLVFSDCVDREVITAHGFANYQISLWNYNTMNKIIDLTGHTQRVLQLAVNPSGKIICSGAADETLRFWNIFKPQLNENESNLGNVIGGKRIKNKLQQNILNRLLKEREKEFINNDILFNVPNIEHPNHSNSHIRNYKKKKKKILNIENENSKKKRGKKKSRVNERSINSGVFMFSPFKNSSRKKKKSLFNISNESIIILDNQSRHKKKVPNGRNYNKDLNISQQVPNGVGLFSPLRYGKKNIEEKKNRPLIINTPKRERSNEENQKNISKMSLESSSFLLDVHSKSSDTLSLITDDIDHKRKSDLHVNCHESEDNDSNIMEDDVFLENIPTEDPSNSFRFR